MIFSSTEYTDKSVTLQAEMHFCIVVILWGSQYFTSSSLSLLDEALEVLIGQYFHGGEPIWLLPSC